METESQRKKRPGLLRPEELSKIKNLAIVAKGVVEGFVAGHHKSPFKGFSLEFAEHRKYVPGDEPRHIDWKVFGRTHKYFVKLFEAETNMRVYLALDASQSMGFSGGSGYDKLTYATLLTAALCFLVNKQQDLAGLVTFNERITDFIPPRHSSAHLRNLMQKLSSMKALGRTRTASVLTHLAERINRRGLIVLISDLLDDRSEILTAIARFRHRKHEVVVFHILDNAEWVFPYKTMTEFFDMESSQRIRVDPIALRTEYLKAMEDFRRQYQLGCAKMNVDYVPVNTLMPFEHILSSYLSTRRKLS